MAVKSGAMGMGKCWACGLWSNGAAVGRFPEAEFLLGPCGGVAGPGFVMCAVYSKAVIGPK